MEIIRNQLNYGHAAAALRKPQETNYGLEEDRISRLPDDIIVSILSYLRIDEAARTCILSHRWEKLWRFNTKLVFDDSKSTSLSRYVKGSASERLIMTEERSKFVNWVNKVVKSHEGQIIDEFRISSSLDYHHSSEINHWIIFAAKKKVKLLELNFSAHGILFLPLPKGYYSFSGLIHGSDLCPDTFSSLTSLCLNSVFVNSQSIDYFLSNCPSLERLCLHSVLGFRRLTISGSNSNSLKLKHLEITGCENLESLEISAMSLVSFIYYACVNDMIEMSLKSTPSLVETTFGGFCCLHLHSIFSQLSSCLSQLTMLTLDYDQLLILNSEENFPQLSNLKQLHLKVEEVKDQSFIPWIGLVEACPMLSRLKMQVRMIHQFKGGLERKAAKESHKCLRVVEMVGFDADSTAVDFLMCLIHNAASLEKIIIDPHGWNLEDRGNSKFKARIFGWELRMKLAPNIEVQIK